MSHNKGSVQAAYETRHSLLMGYIIELANKYSSHVGTYETEIEIMDADHVEISTYYYALNEQGINTLYRIAHMIQVRSDYTAVDVGP